MSSSRRSFTAGLTAALAAAWLDLPVHRLQATFAAAQEPGDQAGFKVLSPAEAADLDAMAERIIPRDDTPGAHEARVVRFIDQGLATFAAEQLSLVRDGLRDLRLEIGKRYRGATTFAGLTVARQVETLGTLEKAKSPFFEAVLAASIAGFLADPKYGGNHQKIGWRLIGFDDRFSWQPPFGHYDAPPKRPR